MYEFVPDKYKISERHPPKNKSQMLRLCNVHTYCLGCCVQHAVLSVCSENDTCAPGKEDPLQGKQ